MTEDERVEQLFREAFTPFTERGFFYTHTYEKGSDRSCTSVHRFRKGTEYFELRSAFGGDESLVVYSDGRYRFPDLKSRHKKEFSAFSRKHFLHRAGTEERIRFAGEILALELAGGNFFGIPV